MSSPDVPAATATAVTKRQMVDDSNFVSAAAATPDITSDFTAIAAAADEVDSTTTLGLKMEDVNKQPPSDPSAAVPDKKRKSPDGKSASSSSGNNKTNNDKRKKPRRVIPENKEYLPFSEDPSQHDVIGGRGGRSNHHPGNRPYWMKILEARSVYRACASDVAKSQIAQSIKDYVCIILGGRFLNLDDQTKRWFVLPDNVVLDKIKQALRDRYVPYWAKNMTINPLKGFSEVVSYSKYASSAAGAAGKATHLGSSSSGNTGRTEVKATNLDFLLAAVTEREGADDYKRTKHDPIPSVDDVLKKKIDTLPTFDKARGAPGLPQMTTPVTGFGAMNAMNPMFNGSGFGGPMGLGMMGHLGGAASSAQLQWESSSGLRAMGFGNRRQSYQTGPPSFGMFGFHSISGLESLTGVLASSGAGGPSPSASSATGRRGSNTTSASPGVSFASDEAMKDFIANINATTSIAGATAAAAIRDSTSAPDPLESDNTDSKETATTTTGRSVDNERIDRFMRNRQLFSLPGSQSFFPYSAGMMNGLSGSGFGGCGNGTHFLDFVRSVLGNNLPGEMAASGGHASSLNLGLSGLSAIGAAATPGLRAGSDDKTDPTRVDFSAMYSASLTSKQTDTKEV